MKTRCPHCRSIFSVDEQQLSKRHGQVRCGNCRKVFDAIDNLISPSGATAIRPSDSVRESMRPRMPSRDQYDSRPARGSRPLAEAREPREPRYSSRQPERRVERSRAGGDGFSWGTVLFVLAAISFLVLVVQSALVFRNQIVYYFPKTRSVLQQLCSIRGCELGTMRHSEQISLSDARLSLRPDAAPQAGFTQYVLQGRLSNKSDAPSPWPALVLSLTDTNNSTIIRRIIEAKDYLPPDLQQKPMAENSDFKFNLPFNARGSNFKGYNLSLYFSKE